MPTRKKTTATKKTAAKKTAKKTAAKKVAKKATKKTAKKVAAKKTAKKVAAKKTAKKAAAKKTAKKAAAKKTAKKAAKKVAKKTAKKAAKKVAAKKTAKTVAKKTAKKAAKKTAKKAAKKTAKKAAKKTATKKAPAKRAPDAKADVESIVQHATVKLPTRTLSVPASYEAATTLVPDALDDAMGDAFDALFVQDPVPLPAAAPKKAPKPFVPGDPSEDLAQICAAIALDKKAEDVVILRVAELTSYADFFVIAAATSDRQAQAVARAVTDELRSRGRQPLSTDGMDQGNWVVLDYGSVVVHIFMQTARAYYDLDGFWNDAPKVEVDEDHGKAALQALGT